MSTPEQEQATKPVEEQPAEKKEEDGEEETDENKDDTHVETVGEAMLAPVEIETGEEGEEVVWKHRAKLFRFDKDEQAWKERGAGDVKFLKAPEGGSIRLLMRRDGTHKVCANHYVRPDVELKQSVGSDRSWVWTAVSDMADGEPTDDVLAIRFQTAEVAAEFKHEMEKAKTVNEEYEKGKKEKGEL